MSAQIIIDSDTDLILRSCSQKIASGPEYSKDLSFDEPHIVKRGILEDKAGPVRLNEQSYSQQM